MLAIASWRGVAIRFVLLITVFLFAKELRSPLWFLILISSMFAYNVYVFYTEQKSLKIRDQYAKIFLDDFMNYSEVLLPDDEDIIRNIKGIKAIEMCQRVLKFSLTPNMSDTEFFAKRDEIALKLQQNYHLSKNQELYKRQINLLDYIVGRVKLYKRWA